MPPLQDLLNDLKRKGKGAASCVTAQAAALLASRLPDSRRLVIVTSDADSAVNFARDLSLFLEGARTYHFPPAESFPYEELTPDPDSADSTSVVRPIVLRRRTSGIPAIYDDKHCHPGNRIVFGCVRRQKNSVLAKTKTSEPDAVMRTGITAVALTWVTIVHLRGESRQSRFIFAPSLPTRVQDQQRFMAILLRMKNTQCVPAAGWFGRCQKKCDRLS